MDRTELNNRLIVFKNHCESIGYPLTDMCIEEAFPGDDATSYLLKVKADWIDGVDCCGNALDILINALWDTTDEDTRKYIFAIDILDRDDNLHCESGELQPQSELRTVS